ncbi:MAG: hypothetical protein KTR18_08800 [Acidiferrobacterales bacterium]|nr:hypothetical protein [Acidiferrobacterales bacterium]
MQSIRLVATLALSVFATHASAYGPFKKPGSSYFSAGDTVVLNQEVRIGAGSRVYIQGGEAKPRKDVHEARPYCYISLYRSSAVIETPVTVAADKFTVSKTSNYYELVQSSADPFQVASRSFFQEDSEKTLITRIRISSTTQPEVVGLHCGIWAVAGERNHVSLAEIKSALGDLISLELAKE